MELMIKYKARFKKYIGEEAKLREELKEEYIKEDKTISESDLKFEGYKKMNEKLENDYREFCQKQERPREFTKTEMHFINTSQ